MQHYFDIFDLPVSFDINKQQLKTSFNAQIIQFHPDKFSDETMRNQAVQNTSLLNTAFNTLDNDLERAAYLLELNNINAFDEKDTQMNSSFLMEMIDLQEALETLEESAKINTFITTIDTKINNTTQQLSAAFLQQNFDGAKNLVRELKFYNQTKDKAQQKQKF
jgi:molecular chaperone HscB